MKLKTGDKVTVIAGADKGKTGKVLKVLEDKLLNASECSIKLEQALFQEIRNKLFVYIPQLHQMSFQLLLP